MSEFSSSGHQSPQGVTIMRGGRLLAGFLLAGVLAATPGFTIGLPGHVASGTGTLPGGSTLGINAGDAAGVGGSGLVTLTPPGANPIRVLLTCVAISVPAIGLTTGHTLGASGVGSDLQTYFVTITDSATTGVPDTAGVSNTVGIGSCGGPPAVALPGDPYLILL